MIYCIIILIIIFCFICYNKPFKNNTNTNTNTNTNLQKKINLSNDNKKKNYNYVEFFENPPNQKCNRYTRNFSNKKDKLLMDLNKFKENESEITRTNKELGKLYNEMNDLCNNQNRSKNGSGNGPDKSILFVSQK